MPIATAYRAFPLALCVLGLGCDAPLTREEAAQAVDEVSVSTQAVTLAAESVEISTNFTIGEAVTEAAAELKNFIESQIPCAEITISNAKLAVEYGVNGTCPFRFRSYTGAHSISVDRNDESEVVVSHSWAAFSNGEFQLDGSAVVTWNFANPSRHVEHAFEWTRLSDERRGVGTGDRVQKLLNDDLLEGIVVDGARGWEGESGKWDLDIDGVEVRWIDPVPQAGTYTLDTPFDKQLTLTFERLEPTVIAVTAESGRREFTINVASFP